MPSVEEQAKIAFRLVRDEDGYPPADWEHLWARAVGADLYLIDNTPFFVYGISLGDLVKAEPESGLLVYQYTVKRSLHSTLRVMLFRKDQVDQLRERLDSFGCATELSHIRGLVAVDVPPEVSLPLVRALLDEGEEKGDWEYEESALRA
jgi:hypothetical protein